MSEPLPVGRFHAGAVLLRRWTLMVRLWRAGVFGRLLARLIRVTIQRRFGCFLSPDVKLGACVYLPHPTGIVIGDGVVVGDNVTIYQHVTLGQKGDESGYPVIEAGATLFAGCVVIGAIRVGADAVVGANAVVRHDVPDGATAVGVPARILDRP